MIRAREEAWFPALWACLVMMLISTTGLQGAEDAAEPGIAEPAPSPVSSGWVETVWIVRDLDVWIHVFEQVGAYELAHRGPVDGRLAAYWGVDSGAEGKGIQGGIQEALMRNPGTGTGFVRLLQLPGEAAPIHRPFAQSWDSGGHFDVNMRTRDIDASIDQLEALGWSAQSAPVEFSFGPFRVREVLARGPDGIVLALIQRLEPTLEGWPHLRRWSRIFNSTQIVADFDANRDFYQDVLGFQTYLDHEGASQKEGPNVLGLPHDLTTKVPRQVAILSPDGRNEGSIEILAFQGIRGADFSDRADPPHRGIHSLRFPVEKLDAFQGLMAQKGVEIVAGPAELEIANLGRVRMLAIRTPGGAWLEFFESAEDR